MASIKLDPQPSSPLLTPLINGCCKNQPCSEKLRGAVVDLSSGLKIDHWIIFAKDIHTGRFCEELNLSLYLKKDGIEKFLMYIKIFFGRAPYYKPWVEFFNMNYHFSIRDEVIDYYDSALENCLISFFSEALEPGGKIFIEYYNDKETHQQLEAGFPPATTRLGYKMFKTGFTWFKDWYFPEGFMEGEQKLQGEKPLDETTKNRQLTDINNEVKSFLEKMSDAGLDNANAARSIKRARDILKQEFLQ